MTLHKLHENLLSAGNANNWQEIISLLPRASKLTAGKTGVLRPVKRAGNDETCGRTSITPLWDGISWHHEYHPEDIFSW